MWKKVLVWDVEISLQHEFLLASIDWDFVALSLPPLSLFLVTHAVPCQENKSIQTMFEDFWFRIQLTLNCGIYVRSHSIKFCSLCFVLLTNHKLRNSKSRSSQHFWWNVEQFSKIYFAITKPKTVSIQDKTVYRHK